MLLDSKDIGDLRVGALLDDAQPQRDPLIIGEALELGAHHSPELGKARTPLQLLDVRRIHSRYLHSKPLHEPAVRRGSLKEARDLSPRDRQQPRTRLGLGGPAEATPALVGLSERLRSEVERDLRIEHPPSAEQQNPLGLPAVERDEAVRLTDRTAKSCALPLLVLAGHATECRPQSGL